MIIDGGTHDNAGNLARYLLRRKPGEKEFMMELRDAATEDLTEALTDWELIGRGQTKGNLVLYHTYLRLPAGESLKEAQWYKVIEDLETKLKFTNQPRAIIGHNSEENGLHLHVVWSRYDPEKNTLIHMGHDRKHFHTVAREAAKEFGLKPTIARSKEQKKRTLSNREIRALKDRGIDKDKLLKIVRAAWDACESGEEMRAMLSALKVEIKPGERRDWVVEYKGLKMNPVRLLDDVNEATFRDRMKDVDLTQAKEKEKDKSREGAQLLRSRRADYLIRKDVKLDFANEEPKQAKGGFTRKKHRAPQPTFKRKLWYGNPGI
jgi:hypothetical protein